VAVAISDLAPSFSADHGKKQLQAARVSVGRVVWAVEVVSRYMPGVKSRSGSGYTGAASPVQSPGSHPHRCCSPSQGQLQAHAWVESQGRIVSGGLKICGAIPLPLLEGKYNERDRWHLPPGYRTVDSADLANDRYPCPPRPDGSNIDSGPIGMGHRMLWTTRISLELLPLVNKLVTLRSQPTPH